MLDDEVAEIERCSTDNPNNANKPRHINIATSIQRKSIRYDGQC